MEKQRCDLFKISTLPFARRGNTSVSILNRQQAGSLRIYVVILSKGKKFFSPAELPARLWGWSNHLFNGYGAICSWRKGGRSGGL